MSAADCCTLHIRYTFSFTSGGFRDGHPEMTLLHVSELIRYWTVKRHFIMTITIITACIPLISAC